MRFSDYELGLKARWFTGEEWANGTAERECVGEYREAIERRVAQEKSKSPQLRAKEKADRRYAAWFANSLRQDQ
jgi:hypothetical protein